MIQCTLPLSSKIGRGFLIKADMNIFDRTIKHPITGETIRYRIINELDEDRQQDRHVDILTDTLKKSAEKVSKNIIKKPIKE